MHRRNTRVREWSTVQLFTRSIRVPVQRPVHHGGSGRLIGETSPVVQGPVGPVSGQLKPAGYPYHHRIYIARKMLVVHERAYARPIAASARQLRSLGR